MKNRGAPDSVTEVSDEWEKVLVATTEHIRALELKLTVLRATQRVAASAARHNGMSLRAIAKLAGVSNVAVLKWTREAS